MYHDPKCWLSKEALCWALSVIVSERWYKTSRRPAVQCCFSLRVSPHSLTPPTLPSSLTHFPSTFPPRRSAWFIFPVPASVPCDLYVYGHYWRWVIHIRFSPSSLSSRVSLLWQSPGVLQGISMTLFLVNHSLSLALTTPLKGRRKEAFAFLRCLLCLFVKKHFNSINISNINRQRLTALILYTFHGVICPHY